MKVLGISDTHSRTFDIDNCDLLLHAGDFSFLPKRFQFDKDILFEELLEFKDSLSNWNHKAKNIVFTPGNHDFVFQNFQQEAIDLIKDVCTVLIDDHITIDGIKIWGSPYQPEFHNWAFNKKRGEEIKTHWDKIPHDTDILLTHGPAYDFVDKTSQGAHVGCVDLLNAIKRVKPLIHVSGHIHESSGWDSNGETIFLNASSLDLRYNLAHKPYVFIINKDKSITY